MTRIDREKLRVAVRRMGNEYIFYMLDDAIELLPPSKLVKLAGRYLDVKSLQASGPKHAGLLAEVKAFEKASRAGDYYESFAVNSKNYREVSAGTRAWIAECARLFGRCVAATGKGNPEETCEAFEMLLALLQHIDQGMDVRPLVAQLPREECDRFLCRFAQGDATAGMELKKQLLALEPRPPAASGPGRSIDELLKRAEAIETARRRRQEQEARRKHETEMKTLAERETDTWQQVASLVDFKQTKSYDKAVQLLAKLAQLAEFRGSQDDYRRRVNELCDRYKRLSGFRWRVERAKLLVDRDAPPIDQDEP